MRAHASRSGKAPTEGRALTGCRALGCGSERRVGSHGTSESIRGIVFVPPFTRLSRIIRRRRPLPRRRNEDSVLDTATLPIVPQTSPPSESPAPAPRTRGSATGAIRTLGSNPATAPIVLHPGDAIPARRRVLYIVLLGALTALGPFTIDLYLPAFPVLENDFQTSATAIQLTLTGTMIGFALGQLIVGPLSDKVGRRIPLLSVTALPVAARVLAALAPRLELICGY